MGYHAEDAIVDKVVPAFDVFLKSEKTVEDLVCCIEAIACDRLSPIILNAILKEGRIGRKLLNVLDILTEYEMSLKEVHIVQGNDLIIEKFDEMQE